MTEAGLQGRTGTQLAALLGAEVEVCSDGLPQARGIVYTVDPSTSSVVLLQARCAGRVILAHVCVHRMESSLNLIWCRVMSRVTRGA